MDREQLRLAELEEQIRKLQAEHRQLVNTAGGAAAGAGAGAGAVEIAI